jgi:hydroxymethylglutaryl-CoA lyase
MAEIAIWEVGPRDGLQNEPCPIPTPDKIELVDLLTAAGLRRIEVTSFVSARWVPQLADAAEVMAGITRRPGVAYGALTPNLRGYEAAVAAGADVVAIFAAASESFSQRNINATIAESLARFAPVADAARRDGVALRGYVSCVTDCPYEGPVAPARVAEVAGRLLELGCYEVSLGDTLGRGTPDRVAAMLEAVLAVAPAARFAGHFHDTKGQALANIDAALAHGLTTLDSAAGGLGGCPYAPGAAGNVSTEAVAAHLAAAGHVTNIDLNRLAIAAEFARSLRAGRTR